MNGSRNAQSLRDTPIDEWTQSPSAAPFRRAKLSLKYANLVLTQRGGLDHSIL